MSKLTIILILTFYTYSVHADCTSSKPNTLKTYNIDLDQDPHLRFQEVATDFKDGILELVNAQKSVS
jgi:hypothetical protein